MYHVFEYDYETLEFRGSVETLKEAYDMVERDAAELYENTADDLTLRHIASFFEESQAIDGDYSRAHRKRGWEFVDERPAAIIEEYNERYVNNTTNELSFKDLDGRGIYVTGWIAPGKWVREE